MLFSDIEECTEVTQQDFDMMLFSPAPSTSSILSPSSEVSITSSYAENNRNGQQTKKKKHDNPTHEFQLMVQTLQDTAASLNTANIPGPEPSKFDWLAKYIAASLNEMDSTIAQQKSKQILDILHSS